MKALVTKVSINAGRSTKNDPAGRDYEISTCTILVPFEPRQWDNANGKGESRGFGLDSTEIELEPSALLAFRDLKFPIWLELETITEYRRNGAISVVTGFTIPQLKAA